MHLSSAQLIGAVCNFLSLIILARFLGPVLQGEWSLYINAFTFGIFFLSLGIPQAIVHFIASGKMTKEGLIKKLLFLCLILAFLFFGVASAVYCFSSDGVFLPNSFGEETVKYLLILTLHFMILLSGQLFSSILHAENDFSRSSLISAAGAILLLLSYSLFYFFAENYNTGFFYCLIVNLIVVLLQFAFYLVVIYRNHRIYFRKAKLDVESLRPMVIFSSWIYITNLLQFLNYKMDLWFISAFEMKDAELGIYTIAVSLAQLVWLIPNAFHTYIYTKVSESEHFTDGKKIASWTGQIFLYAVLASVIGCFLAFELVPLLFGQEFARVALVIPLLLPGIVIYSGAICLSAFFAGKNKVNINFQATLIGFCLCLLLDFVLIPKYGIVGAALASSVSYIGTALFLYRRYIKFCDLRFKDYFNWKMS